MLFDLVSDLAVFIAPTTVTSVTSPSTLMAWTVIGRQAWTAVIGSHAIPANWSQRDQARRGRRVPDRPAFTIQAQAASAGWGSPPPAADATPPVPRADPAAVPAAPAVMVMMVVVVMTARLGLLP